MECYKCQATEDLSVKKRQRGKTTWICRTCRRDYAKHYQPPEKAVIDTEWYDKARQSHLRVLRTRT